MARAISLAALALAGALSGCTVDVEGAACTTPGSTENCPAGQACGASLKCSAAAAACTPCMPGSQKCDLNLVVECSAAKDPACGTFEKVDDCGLVGLSCGAGSTPACVCPAHLESPVVLHVDPAAASRPGLVRNGALTSACRYLTLGDALSAAAAGNTVKAVGYAGAPVVFTEPPLAVPDGVAVVTDDATPTPANYVMEPSAAVGAGTFVTLRPGASLSGFSVRNTSATGAGVETSCPGTGDVATVTVDGVRISGLGAGAAPAPRFSNGLRHGGNCSLTLTNSTVEGANDTGVLVTGAAASTSLTMTGNLIQLNQANVTPYSIGTSDRFGGGLIVFGVHPGTVAFKSNQFLANAGDQILVFSPGTLDLSTPACTAESNVVACYTAPGVGVSSRFGTLNVAHTSWQNDLPAVDVDFVVATGATISGATTQSCGHFTGACPTP